MNIQYLTCQQKKITNRFNKPFKDIENHIFANVINLNQYGSRQEKLAFNEWQSQITHNGMVEIDIFEFQYEVLNIL